MDTITTENSVIINRPIQEVFDTATCMESCINWWTMVQDAKKVSTGPVGIGTEYHHVGKFMGITMESHPVITVLDAPYHFAYTSATPTATMDVYYDFEGVNGGTKLTSKMIAKPNSDAIPAEMLETMMSAFSRQFDSDMANLKDMMEKGVKVKLG